MIVCCDMLRYVAWVGSLHAWRLASLGTLVYTCHGFQGSRAQGLQKENQAFLMMCKKGEEQYSEPEIVYYGGEAGEGTRRDLRDSF